MPTKKISPRGTKARPARRTPAAAPQAPAKARPGLRFAPIALEQVSAMADLLAGGYPLFITDREKNLAAIHEVYQARYPEMIGAFNREDRIIGGYALYELVATIRGRGLPAAGLGMVATALDRKKQHVALELVRDFVRRARQRRMPVSLLYPFRHDFYGDMGWAAVGQARQHSVRADSFPLYPERETVRWVQSPAWNELDLIHRRVVGRQGALGLSRHPQRWRWMLRRAQHAFLAGPPEAPEGYLLANFRKQPELPDSFHYDLEVLEMEWTTPRALRAFLGFLSSQRDQVIEVILNWPVDGNLEAVLRDPVRRQLSLMPGHLGPGASIGHGAMLRLENPREAFRLRPYSGSGRVALSVSTRDPLFEDRALRFRALIEGEENGAGKPAAVELSAGLATLARLWAGALTFAEALAFGLAELNPAEAAEPLDRLFELPPPWIVEQF